MAQHIKAPGMAPTPPHLADNSPSILLIPPTPAPPTLQFANRVGN